MICPNCKLNLDPVKDWNVSQRGKSGRFCKWCVRIDSAARRIREHEQGRGKAAQSWLESRAKHESEAA